MALQHDEVSALKGAVPAVPSHSSIPLCVPLVKTSHQTNILLISEAFFFQYEDVFVGAI